MKRVETILFSLLVILTCSCHSEQIVPTQSLSLNTNIQSRNSMLQSLPAGSQILVNTRGNLSLSNEIFTFNGTFWENEQASQYPLPPGETQLVALYPVYEDKLYSTDNIYSEGNLKDVLIAHETFSGQASIDLKFKHLFSMFILHLEAPLDRLVKEIRLTTPSRISYISPMDGTFTTTDESHTSHLICNGSEDYSFVIPPQEECILTLFLLMTDGTSIEMELNPHTFLSGFQYRCNLYGNDSGPGIRTAEDLIIFSQLINGTYSGDKTLADFGKETNGETVFRLMNDITFTEEECSRFHPIGKYDPYPFAYIFEGNGYTISNLILPDQNASGKQTGMFGNISEEGIIRNLNLSHATTIQTPNCKYIGVLSANNLGKIINCSVVNSTIHTIEYNYVGLISSKSSGAIINCYSKDNTIHVESRTQVGAIAGYASGYILNSFTCKNRFSTKGEGYRIGSISGASASNKLLTIENCYIHHAQSTSLWGAAVGLPYRISVNHFFYNKEKIFNDKPTSSETSNTFIYNSNFQVDDTPVSTLLNEWMVTTGGSKYPEYAFRRWKTDADGFVCFE